MTGRSTHRRRLLPLAVILAALAAAAFFAVGAFTGGTRQQVASIPYPAPAGGEKAAPKGDPDAGGQPVTGEGRENNEITARDQWFFHQRAYPSKLTAPGALARATSQTLALRRSSTDVAAAPTITWSRLGPNPITPIGPDAEFNSGPYGGAPPLSGRVSAIAPAPSNANVVYLGGANGAIWKSTNGGANWTPLWSNTVGTFSVGSIAVNPTNYNDVWVGTGEANGSSDTYYGNGIFHSTNGGVSWVKVGGTTFNGCFVSGLDFVSASVINAAVLEFPGVPNPACATAKRGVWHITNANTATPTLTHVTLPGSSYQAPNNFASVGNTVYVATYLEGVWRSLNGGASWTKIVNLPNRYRQAVSAYNASTLYLVGSDSSGLGFGGLYRIGAANTSSPTVTTISNPASSNTACTYPAAGGGQCSYDLTVAADPTNVNRSFVGGIRVYRFIYAGSPTPGAPIGYGGTAGKIHVDQHATIFDAAHNMWEGSDGGAYRLPAAQLGVAAPAFQNRNGAGATALGITEFNGWLSGSTAAGVYLGGTQDNGTVKFTSFTGLNWRMDHGGDGGASAYINPSVYFASYYGTAVYRTTTGGNCGSPSCSAYKQIFSSSDPAEFYPPMEQAPANVYTLYRGTNRIWRTTNDTATTPTWAAISPVFTAPVTAIGVQKVTAPNYLYAGVDAGSSTLPRLYYTHNAATTHTWSSVTAPGSPARYITDIWVNPANAANAILTESGFGTGHVFKTVNGGATWTNISGNLPNVPVNAVAVDPTNVSKVFLGTDTGMFWTTNGTVASPTWVNTSSGLPNTTVMDLKIDKVGTSTYYLIAATHGRGSWRALKP